MPTLLLTPAILALTVAAACGSSDPSAADGGSSLPDASVLGVVDAAPGNEDASQQDGGSSPPPLAMMVAPSREHTCALNGDGALKCWRSGQSWG